MSKKRIQVDWERCERLLLDGSRSALETFLGQRPRGELCAIGYVFELGNESPQFDLCADTWTNRKRLKDWQSPDVRWNSGNYEFPAGLSHGSELGTDWNAESKRLHNLAEDERHFAAVYKGLVDMSCLVLVKRASEGLLGDWRLLDYNVSETGDPTPTKVVAARDAKIKKLIESGSSS